jgi:hypothetical protein
VLWLLFSELGEWQTLFSLFFSCEEKQLLFGAGNFCKAKDKESGAGQRSSRYQSHQGGTYATPDSTTCSRIDDTPLRADHRGLFMLRWAAAVSDVDFLTKKLPRTIVKNFEAKHARQEKENQKANQSPRPQTPQRGQRG